MLSMPRLSDELNGTKIISRDEVAVGNRLVIFLASRTGVLVVVQSVDHPEFFEVLTTAQEIRRSFHFEQIKEAIAALSPSVRDKYSSKAMKADHRNTVTVEHYEMAYRVIFWRWQGKVEVYVKNITYSVSGDCYVEDCAIPEVREYFEPVLKKAFSKLAKKYRVHYAEYFTVKDVVKVECFDASWEVEFTYSNGKNGIKVKGGWFESEQDLSKLTPQGREVYKPIVGRAWEKLPGERKALYPMKNQAA